MNTENISLNNEKMKSVSKSELSEKFLKIEFDEFGLNWTKRHLDAEQLFKEDVMSTYYRRRIDNKDLEVINHEIYNSQNYCVMKIQTFKKRFNLKYEAVIQKQKIDDSFTYFIDTIQSDWLVRRNKLIIDSLLFSRENGYSCGTAIKELEKSDFPNSNEKEISKKEAEKVLNEWLN